jgi:hypothetical protein
MEKNALVVDRVEAEGARKVEAREIVRLESHVQPVPRLRPSPLRLPQSPRKLVLADGPSSDQVQVVGR